MSDLISRADIPYHKQLEPMGNGQYFEVEVAYKDDIDALPSAEAEDRHYIKIYADDEPSVKAEKLYQICGETQNREVAEWLKEYFPSAEPKTGKWINRSMNICYPEWERYTCSECGKHSYIYDYCPNCGARMTPYKGGEEE